MLSNHLHYDFNAGSNNVIQIILDGPAEVLLLDDLNYQNLISGRLYSYYGGKVDISPYNLKPPSSNHWHLVIRREVGIPAASIKII